MGRKRLSPSAGAGKKIMDNLDLFSYDLKERDGTLYIFDVKFDETEGGCSIRLNEDDEIERMILNMKNFKLSLLEYNDPTLTRVGEMMIMSIKNKV